MSLEIKQLILCTCLNLLSILWDGSSDFRLHSFFFRYLSYNKIRQIKKRHFQNSPLTSSLYLARNEIGWIEDGTFNHVASSGTLYEIRYIIIIWNVNKVAFLIDIVLAWYIGKVKGRKYRKLDSSVYIEGALTKMYTYQMLLMFIVRFFSCQIYWWRQTSYRGFARKTKRC